MSEEIKPFKVHIPDSELELLRKKLELVRLPESLSDSVWGEEAEGGVTLGLIRDTVKHWQTAYDWRAEEARINQMPQFTTVVEIQGFDPVEVHFVHAKAPSSAREGGAVPLLFLHGWPGSFIEVQPMLPLLLEAGFDVVAPSLMGYGFSSYPRQQGFTVRHHAEAFHKVMGRLGYGSYVVQGGDWGSFVGRTVIQLFPESVKALHLNLLTSSRSFQDHPEGEKLTKAERDALARGKWYRETNSAYLQLLVTKPRTIGYALHDSPVGMLSWMADKLLLWSDTDAKAWTADELITWTLLHYFPGPTTGMLMYRENPAGLALDHKRTEQPVGISHFLKELAMSPRSWGEKDYNITFWRVHEKGGHFAAYERPEEMAADIIEFFNAHWGN